MKQEELNKILNEHKLWLYSNGGSRADLQGANLRDANLWDADLRDADLRDADLRGANLWDADLRGANLWDADLRFANLRGANLWGADLRGANLWDADLRDADLRGANLWDADLRFADLRGADLRGADLRDANLWDADLRDANGANTNCPESGSFVAYKKAMNGTNKVIVKLQVTEDAKRSSATGRKCRCSKALVLEISDIANVKTDIREAFSSYDTTFVYKVGEVVTVENFDDDRWNECTAGIHFFITRQEAVDY